MAVKVLDVLWVPARRQEVAAQLIRSHLVEGDVRCFVWRDDSSIVHYRLELASQPDVPTVNGTLKNLLKHLAPQSTVRRYEHLPEAMQAAWGVTAASLRLIGESGVEGVDEYAS